MICSIMISWNLRCATCAVMIWRNTAFTVVLCRLCGVTALLVSVTLMAFHSRTLPDIPVRSFRYLQHKFLVGHSKSCMRGWTLSLLSVVSRHVLSSCSPFLFSTSQITSSYAPLCLMSLWIPSHDSTYLVRLSAMIWSTSGARGHYILQEG